MRKILFAGLLICLPVLAHAQTSVSGTADRQGAKQFVDQFWSEWSGPNETALPYIRSVIDDPINFDGKSMSRDAYINAEKDFTKRWPDRQYTAQADSETISCQAGTSTCDVNGIVNWKDFSPNQDTLSVGSEKFDFLLREKIVSGKVLYLLTGEFGSVISRNANQQAVPQYECADTEMGHPDQTTGDPLQVEIPISLIGKIAFYADARFGNGVFAPDGWGCGIDRGPHTYIIDAAQDYSQGSEFSIDQPEVEEQYAFRGFRFDSLFFYNVVVPLFPQYYPGGLAAYIRPIYKGMGFSPSDSTIEKGKRLGADDEIIHVNNHMVVVVTPSRTNGFATYFTRIKFNELVYSIVGVASVKGGGNVPTSYMIEIRPPSTPGYPIEALLKLNERQLEKDLSKAAGGN